MHRLLDKQVKEALRPDGEIDLARLLAAVESTYARTDDERRGIVRSMQLMSDEATTLTRELRESTASQLQAVLDHVKDVIVTVDEAGHIVSLNATGQRVFGHAETEIAGRSLSFLLPQLADKQTLAAQLEQLAARLDDTQVDLAPHETLGLHFNGTHFPAELAVSKTMLNRRSLFVVCLRDTTDRKAADAALRDSEARYRTLVEHAPEIIVVVDLDRNQLADVNENAVRFFKMDRAALLTSNPDALSPPQQPDGSQSARRQSRAVRADAGRRGAGCSNGCSATRSATTFLAKCAGCACSRGAHRLIRGSITDITERKRSELLAAGERRVFERLAANVDLRITLEAITEVTERVSPDTVCALRLLDESGVHLTSVCRPAPAGGVRTRLGDDRGRGSQRLVRGRRLFAAAGHRGRYRSRRVVGKHARRRAGRRPAQLLVDADPLFRRPHPRHARAVFQDAAQPAAP